jgi:hypothetical protein
MKATQGAAQPVTAALFVALFQNLW